MNTLANVYSGPLQICSSKFVRSRKLTVADLFSVLGCLKTRWKVCKGHFFRDRSITDTLYPIRCVDLQGRYDPDTTDRSTSQPPSVDRSIDLSPTSIPHSPLPRPPHQIHENDTPSSPLEQRPHQHNNSHRSPNDPHGPPQTTSPQNGISLVLARDSTDALGV